MALNRSQTVRLVQVDILLPAYRVVGQVKVTGTGLVGLLNDPTTSFLEVLNATTARIHMPSKAAGTHKLIRLVRDQVFVVGVPKRNLLGPLSLQRGGYTQIVPYPVFLTTPVYEVRGTLEWAGRFDFAAVMVEGSRDFVPLLDATVHAIVLPNFQMNAAALLFNRRQVCTLVVE